MTTRSRHTDQQMSHVIATALQAAQSRKAPARPRTYSPGARELKSYTTPRVVREVYRRACESEGKLSDKDLTMFAVELQRRQMGVSAAMVTGAVAATVLTPLLDTLTNQGFNGSLAEIDSAAQEILDEEPASLDESMMEPMTSSDLMMDMREQGISEEVIANFDLVADSMVTDIGHAIEQQIMMEEPALDLNAEAVESMEVTQEVSEL